MRKLITIFSLISVMGSFAQRPQTGVWFAANIPVQFAKKWQVHNDAGYRTIGLSAYVHQYLYRTGLRCLISENLSAAAGVAFFNTRTSYQKANHEFEYEFRLWQELNYQPLLPEKITVQARFRSEQRFFAETSRDPVYLAHRYRLRGGMTYRLTKSLSIELADEYMQQVRNGTGQFNQNRLMASGIYHLNSSTQLQCGYMWLLWSDASQHMISLNIRKNIVLHGHKTKS